MEDQEILRLYLQGNFRLQRRLPPPSRPVSFSSPTLQDLRQMRERNYNSTKAVKPLPITLVIENALGSIRPKCFTSVAHNSKFKLVP